MVAPRSQLSLSGDAPTDVRELFYQGLLYSTRWAASHMEAQRLSHRVKAIHDHDATVCRMLQRSVSSRTRQLWRLAYSLVILKMVFLRVVWIS